MKLLTIFFWICLFTNALPIAAQSLSAKDKSIQISELPEYLVINCDNQASILGRSIRISVQSRNSPMEKSLHLLQELLEEANYLKISNQTDLLTTLSALGYDFIDAFPQNTGESASFNRSGFVFRKKEKYRN